MKIVNKFFFKGALFGIAPFEKVFWPVIGRRALDRLGRNTYFALHRLRAIRKPSRMTVHHLNCVEIESPFGTAVGHCLLLEEGQTLVLIDAGIGLAETQAPEEKLGRELIEATGFRFNEARTAVRQIEQLGLDPQQVKHIVCSHLDPDHIGGLADFPQATVHVAREEYDSFQSGHERYLPQQLAHQPAMMCYATDDREWLSLPARQLELGLETPVFLIPLFGHTAGHCGIAFAQGDRQIFYVGDAYYMRAELDNPNHPVDQLATIRAVDNERRKESLDRVRALVKKQGPQLDYFGYHDPTEWSGSV